MLYGVDSMMKCGSEEEEKEDEELLLSFDAEIAYSAHSSNVFR